jgi:hypothetical protein
MTSRIIKRRNGFSDKLMDKASHVASHQLNKTVDYLVPDLEQSSNEELQEKLKRKAIKLGLVANEVIKDPEVQQIILESGDAFAQLTKELVDAVQEPVIEIADKTLDTASQIILTSGKTAGKTGVDLVMSVLGEVPVVGGIVDLLVSAGVAFNGIAKNVEIGTKNLFEIIEIGNELTGKALVPVKEGVDDYKDISDRAKQVYDRLHGKINNLEDVYSGNGIRIQQPQEETLEQTANERLVQYEPPKRERVDTRLDQPQAPALTQQPKQADRVEQAPALAQQPKQAPALAQQPKQAPALAQQPKQAPALAQQPKQAPALAQQPKQAPALAQQPKQAPALAQQPKQADRVEQLPALAQQPKQADRVEQAPALAQQPKPKPVIPTPPKGPVPNLRPKPTVLPKPKPVIPPPPKGPVPNLRPKPTVLPKPKPVIPTPPKGPVPNLRPKPTVLPKPKPVIPPPPKRPVPQPKQIQRSSSRPITKSKKNAKKKKGKSRRKPRRR